jgi:hypothetical protein
MRLKLICAVLVGLLVIAPGCGSKKKSTSTTSANGGVNLTSAQCANLNAASSIIANAQQGKIPSNIGAQLADLQGIAKVAPASVQADIATLGVAAPRILKALQLKPGQTTLTAAQTTRLMQTLAKMDVAKLTSALDGIGAWGKTVCAGK